MNRYFARVFIAVCGFCVPIIIIGQLWAMAPFMLGTVGIMYYSYSNRHHMEDGKK